MNSLRSKIMGVWKKSSGQYLWENWYPNATLEVQSDRISACTLNIIMNRNHNNQWVIRVSHEGKFHHLPQSFGFINKRSLLRLR